MPLKLRDSVRGSPAGIQLHVTYQPVGDLKPNKVNARLHTPRQIRQIAKSIEEFGFVVPVLADRNGVIIAGEGRYRAALLLGKNEVPTIQLSHLSEEQARALMLADNRLCENSKWNDRLLAEQLRELSLADLDFDIEVTGFEMAEIDLRIESLNEDPAGRADPVDDIPAVGGGPPVSQFGDTWALDRHRLICGDALDPLPYAALLGRDRASLVFTDPPYNVPIAGHVSGLGKIRHREFPMAHGEMDVPAFTNFLRAFSKLAACHSQNGAIHFICMDWRHLGELLAAAQGVYSELKNICVWVKHNAGMGSLYRSQHEFVGVFKYGKGPHHNNVELGRFGRHRSNVWNYPGANSLSGETEEGKLLTFHPTAKPVAMVADAILDCSKRGDIVLDPFLGSGTTLLAAERTGRSCRAIEMDPLYVDVAIRRWQALTGEDARHGKTGKTFTETETQRDGRAANRIRKRVPRRLRQAADAQPFSQRAIR